MSDDVAAALPFLVLAGGGVAIALADRIVRADGRAWSLVAAAIAVAAAASAALPGSGLEGFGGSLRRDGVGTFGATLVAGSTAFALLLGTGRAGGPALLAAELPALVLFSAAGAVLVAGAGDLLVMFVGIELLAVPLYAATGLTAAGRVRTRPALEHFLVGAAASAIFAYGIALLYAATGSFGLGAIARSSAPLGLAGLALIFTSLAARAGLMPLHLWVQPAYRSATTTVAAFMAVVLRVAAFIALLRVGGAVTASGDAAVDWSASTAVLAAITLLIGGVAALRATSLLALVGWSGIAHAGYVAVAAAAGVVASGAVAVALTVYALITIGLFAAIALVGGEARLADLHGLGRRRPFFALALSVLVLGLAGLPPTAGFVARLYVFEAAIGAQLAWLVLVGALGSVIAAAYSLRVVFACLEAGECRIAEGPSAAGAVVVVTALAVVVLGVIPGPLLEAVANVRF